MRLHASRRGVGAVTINGDHGVAVGAACRTLGQRLTHVVLHGEHARERDVDPSRRNLHGETEAVRRVRERHIVRACVQPFNEPQRVAAMHTRFAGGLERLDVAAQGIEASR